MRRQRKALDLTQATLARRVGCAKSTIKKIERRERRPSRIMAERFADSLEIPEAESETFILCGLGEAPLSRLPAPSGPDILTSRHDLPEIQAQKDPVLKSDSSPLISTFAQRPKHNLPIQTTPFIGRERDIQR